MMLARNISMVTMIIAWAIRTATKECSTADSDYASTYGRDGVIWPVHVADEHTFAASFGFASFANWYADFQSNATRLRGRELHMKPHLVSTLLDSIVHSPIILDAVEAVLGPDILLWSSDFAVKPAGQQPGTKPIQWHQDAPYWSLSTNESVSVYFALTASNVANGAMQVVRGSHVLGLISSINYDGDSMAARLTGDFDRAKYSSPDNFFAFDSTLNEDGQRILGADESNAEHVLLEPGEASIHGVETLHGGGVNVSPDARIAFVMRFISGRTRCTTPVRDSAMLMRGRSHHEYVELEPRPDADFSSASLATLERAVVGTCSGFGDRLMKPQSGSQWSA